MGKLAKIAILLWVLTITVGIFYFVKGSTEKSTDNRVAVKLAPAERDLVLAEMRTLLTATNGILLALSEHNPAKASAAAKSAGMKAAADVNPVLMAKLPLEFKSLGMSLHGDFDKLGKDIDGGLSQDQVIDRLGAITSKCIACHSVYRLSDSALPKSLELRAAWAD